MSNNSNEHAQQIAAEDKIFHSLRVAAEKKWANQQHADTPTRSIEETQHELEVRQIELEMQNDELKRAQAIIEESRNRYVEFYDFAPVGYITLGSDGRFEEINLTGAKMLGEERNRLLHRSFVHFVAPEYRDRWQQNFMSVLQHDKKYSCELSLLRGEGTRLDVQLDGLRLRKSEKVTVMRISMTDISERKRAEESILEQKEFFRMITENIEDFIAVVDLEGRRLYNSPSYAKLFYDIDSMKGTDSFAEVHPDDRERVKNVFKETVKSGSGLQIEYRFVLADGSIRHMESHCGLIRNSLGQPSRVVVISRDITERKLAEEKIRNLAFYDALTQLPNRRMLDDRLHHAMAASMRSGRYCAMMFLDLDNFKPLNDLYGHGVGDMLLIEVAHRISSCVREVDTVARFGGDEFVVMLSELDVDKESSIAQTRIVAEKIRTIVAKTYVLSIKVNGNREIRFEHNCTSSIGVVIFINHEYSPEELLKLADMEMYQAKEYGRNQVCFLNT
ncbi:MAG TPA: diguanylate cyclase [Gallionellaceae bacterium]|nr:diguanylate cyclase [Gallionellaceae bacterium]